VSEVHDYDPDQPPGQRWATRDSSQPALPGSQLRVGVDIGDASGAEDIDLTADAFHEMPARRRVQVVVGGTEKLTEILRASDRVRTRMLRRDLKWINSILQAAGMELVIVRDANEMDQ